MTPKFDLSLLPVAPDLTFEQALWQEGFSWVAGIDEAGRGPIAGPVSAAAVILPPGGRTMQTLSGVRDSKQMLPQEREHWAACIKIEALAWGIGFGTVEEVDSLGIIPALHLAIGRALADLSSSPDHLLLDYLVLPDCSYPQTPLVKGDARCLSIAAASVLAKEARDRVMRDLDRDFPEYGFASHKGYCTPGHLEAIEKLGPCPLHRKSFRPFRMDDAPASLDHQEIQT